jgi:hypothetical protein
MSLGLRFLPGVEGDVLSARAWYENKSNGLGEEFLRVFYASVHEIPRGSLLYPEIHGDIRRRLLIRFPYAVYFRVYDGEVVVFGVFHCARDPRTIQTALGAREE